MSNIFLVPLARDDTVRVLQPKDGCHTAVKLHDHSLSFIRNDADNEPRFASSDLSERNVPFDVTQLKVTVTEIKKAGGSRTPAELVSPPQTRGLE